MSQINTVIMENEQILDIFNTLGLDRTQAKAYLATLEIGEALPKQIADRTGISRATLYLSFPELEQRGILVPFQKGKRRLFKAQNPDELLQSLKENVNDLEQSLPDLQAIYQTNSIKPRVQYYDGIEGVKKLYQETLKDKGGIIRAFQRISNIHPEIQKYLASYYSPERVRREIEARNIVSDQSNDKIMPAGKKLFRENRFIDPNKFPFMFEGLIFGSKVGFANFEAGSQLGAIIVDSEEIAKSVRSLFDFAWQFAERQD